MAAAHRSHPHHLSDTGTGEENRAGVIDVSAGPSRRWPRGVCTLGEMMKIHSEHAPLLRNADHLEVGGAALFLWSDLSGAFTGETTYANCG
jgi:enoyl-[acyl-carrier protein] reductase I